MMRLMAVCVLAQAVPLASAAGDGGAFGDWGADAFGLPTYNYTLDQLRDAAVATRYAEGAARGIGRADLQLGRAPDDHVFQFGNDRLIVLASNFGYVQARAGL